MPKNWKTYKLSEFFDINPGIKLKKGQEYSFIEMKNLDPNNKYVLPSDFKKLKGGARFQNGDTLFARITPCLQNGKICQVKGLTDNLGFGSTEFLVFRGKEGVSDTDFVYYLSTSSLFKRFSIGKMIGTSGRQRVAKDAYVNLSLNLPPLQEQRAISSILSAIDDKIELNLQMNRTLEDMAQALYKHWFIDFGPFQNGEFIDSELGKIPKGWEVKKLGEILDVINGYAFKGRDFKEEGIPVLKIKNVKAGKILYGNMAYVEEQLLEKAKRAKIEFKDILITMTGNRFAGSPDTWVGKVAMFLRNGVFYLNQRVSKLSLYENAEDLRHYLTLMLSSEDFQYYFISNSTSSGGQANISPTLVKETSIVIPSTKIMDEFNSQVLIWFDSIHLNEIENETLTKLRDTLLPKLISGEVRVKDAQKLVEEAL